jgi:xanthine dehydrogenase iron-sulfur cluster and FAD-binding subunit A
VLSCLTLAAGVDDKAVTTIEGMAEGDELHPVQQAFLDCDGLQCGFCTPGILMFIATSSFLESIGRPRPGMIVSLAGNLNVLILAASRMLFAMAEGRALPAGLASVHPRFRTPVAAVIATTAVMLALALSRTFLYLVTVSTVARLVYYLATLGALPLLRRSNPGAAVFRLRGGEDAFR